MTLRSLLGAWLGLQLLVTPLWAADINIGIILSATGPAAAIGNAERNGTQGRRPGRRKSEKIRDTLRMFGKRALVAFP